jgi:Raf kinase inhibitor-like YbhB/YbcL family protein
MAFTIRSPAFTTNATIPPQFSRDGGNVSPPVEWAGAPSGTRSFALVVEDPDAPKGTFRHWAAYDIPADSQRLTEGAGSPLQGAALQMGRNDFGNERYDGPQPPPGHGTHHYHFRLFALDVPELDVPAQSRAEDILGAAEEHSIGEADIVGTFEVTGDVAGVRNSTRGIQRGIADADKVARTGKANEPVRNTPPAGDWNDTARSKPPGD